MFLRHSHIECCDYQYCPTLYDGKQLEYIFFLLIYIKSEFSLLGWLCAKCYVFNIKLHEVLKI